MSVFTRRAIVVIPAALRDQANTRCKEAELDPVGGENTFSVGLSASGAAPATHYWCSWQLRPAQYTRLENRIGGFAAVKLYDGDVRTPESILTELGLKRVG